MIEQVNGQWTRVGSFEELEIDDIWRRVEVKSGMDALEVYFERFVPDRPHFQDDRVYIDGNGIEFGSNLNVAVESGFDVSGFEPLYRHDEHHVALRSVEEANTAADFAERQLAELQSVPQGGECASVLALNAEQRDNLLSLLVAIQEGLIRGAYTGTWINEVAANLGFLGEKTDFGNPKLNVDELGVRVEYAHNLSVDLMKDYDPA